MNEQRRVNMIPGDEKRDSPEDPMLKDLVSALAEMGVESVPQEVIESSILNQAHQSAKALLRTLNKGRSKMLTDHRRFRERFERRLQRLWGTALDKLEMLIVCSQEAGEEFNDRWRPTAVREQDFVFEVLVRLHARAIQTSREITILLRSGYAAGAHARWRTLHEISAVAAFVAKHGNETAERYLLHVAVESHKAMVQYREYYEQLGYAAPSKSDVEAVEQQKEALLQRFGKDFYSDYGWAVLPGKSRPKFLDIEAEAGLEHLRPFYRMSGHPIHAGPKGIFFNLGLGSNPDLLPSGASNGGLADPGHSTAISLVQVTTALLGHKTWLQDVTTMRMFTLLADEIGEAFIRAHRRWEKRAGVSEEK